MINHIQWIKTTKETSTSFLSSYFRELQQSLRFRSNSFEKWFSLFQMCENSLVQELYKVNRMLNYYSLFVCLVVDHNKEYWEALMWRIKQNNKYIVEHEWIYLMVVEKRLKTKDDLRKYYDKLVLIKHMKILVFVIHSLPVKHVQSKIHFKLWWKKDKNLTRPSSFSRANHCWLIK
jgi:hypothetical protein